MSKEIKITTEKMTEKEFLRKHPDAIIINNENDLKNFAKTLGVEYPDKKTKTYNVTVSRSILTVENTTIPIDATSEDEAAAIAEKRLTEDPSQANWDDCTSEPYVYQVEEVDDK